MGWTSRIRQPERELFRKHLPFIEGAIEALAHRKRLSEPQERTFRALVLNRLSEASYRALTACDPSVQLEEYLRLFIARVYGEYRDELVSRFRRTLESRFPVPVSNLLQKLIARHVRLEPDAAIRVVRSKFPRQSEAELRELVRDLPPGEGPLDGWVDLVHSARSLARGSDSVDVVPVELQLRIAALPVADHQVVDLVYFRGLAHAEAAALLGMPDAVFFRRLQRILSKLGIKNDGGPWTEAAALLHPR